MPIGIVKNKLDVIENSSPCKAPDTALIVLLPGAYDVPEDFVSQGFVKAVRDRKIAADIVMADTHLGYYSNDLIIERLHNDIMLPAQQRNYSEIWLAGISLGGYGSLAYAKNFGENITGMFLMAPFLGNRSLHAEISQAGGMAKWNPGEVQPGDYDRRLWAWLKGYADSEVAANPAYPRLYVGYGLEDRFAGSNRLLAAMLPESQVSTAEGGHEWRPWQNLWAGFLDSVSLPKCPQDESDNQAAQK